MAMRVRRLFLVIFIVVAAGVLAAPAAVRGQCLECLQKAMASQWNAYDDEIVQSWETYKKTQMQVDMAAGLPAGPQRDQLLAAAKRLHAQAETRWRYAQALMRELTSPEYKAFFTRDLAEGQRALDQAAAALHRKTDVFAKFEKTRAPLRQAALREMHALWQEEDRGWRTFVYDSGAAAVAAVASFAVTGYAGQLKADDLATLQRRLKAAGFVAGAGGGALAQAPPGSGVEMRQKMKVYAELAAFLLPTASSLVELTPANRLALGKVGIVPILAVLVADTGHVLLARRQFEEADARLTTVLTDEAAWRNRLAEDQERVATLRAARDRAAEQVSRVRVLENEIAARTGK